MQISKRWATKKQEPGSVARWSRWHFLRACNKSLAVLSEAHKGQKKRGLHVKAKDKQQKSKSRVLSRGGRGGTFCERVISRLRFFLRYIKVKNFEACT